MTKRRTSRTALAVAAVGGGLLLLTALYLAVLGGTAPGNGPSIGGPFDLVENGGRVVTDRDLRGRYLLIYFGYTSCPDVCPTTLSMVADAMAELGSTARLQPVFITVDPAHDTPQVVDRYVRKFSPDILGLSGSASEIRAVEDEYRVKVMADGDVIDHSAVLYLVGPDGRYLAPLPASGTGSELVARLKTYIR